MKLEEVLMMLCNFVQLGKNLFQQKTTVDIPTLNDGSSSSYMKGPYHSNIFFLLLVLKKVAMYDRCFH